MSIKSMVLALAAVSSVVAFGEEIEGMEYVTSGDVIPGQWNTQYGKCVQMALDENIPLLVFWGRKSCGQCKKLDRANAEPATVAWRKERGYICLYGLEGVGDSSDTLKLARNGGINLPFVAFYWGDRNGDGALDNKDALWIGCGRNGKMPVTSGSLAEQYMASADKYLGGYQPVYPGGKFAASDTKYDRIEVEDPARPLYVTLVREPDCPAGKATLALYGVDGKEVSTNLVSWAAGQTLQDVRLDVSGAFGGVKAAESAATLYLLDDKGRIRETNHVYQVLAPANSAGNPDFSGCALDGRWTMDLVAAKEEVRTNGNYTLVSVQGSLWCHDCANAERNFLDLKDAGGKVRFAEWAKEKKIALVAIDIPNYKSSAAFDAVDTPCLLSTKGALTQLAYETGGSDGIKDVSLGGADQDLTTPYVRSGTPYLSRKGVSLAAATNCWARNWDLVRKNTDEGGLHRPEDTNKFRTGVPIFVLLRKDGSVAARFRDFATTTTGPKKFDADGNEIAQAKYDDYIKYFDQLIEAVGDATEIENNYPSAANELVALTNGVSVAGSLSHVDQQDAIRLGWFNGNGTVKVTADGLPADGLTIEAWLRDAEGNATSLGEAQDGKCVFTGVGQCYVMVSHAKLEVTTPYTFTATTESLDPNSSRTTYTAPADASSLKVNLVKDLVYRIEGAATASLDALFTPVSGNFYRAKTDSGVQEISLSEAGGTLAIQQWQPGTVGFVQAQAPALDEKDCPTNVVVKVVRTDGLSGEVRADVVIDLAKTTLDGSRYEFQATNLVWNDDGIAEREVRILVKPDDYFDGFDRAIVLKLENVTGDEGPTTVQDGEFVNHEIPVVNDDSWIICQNICVDASYPIPDSEGVTFSVKRESGKLPRGIKLEIDNESSPKRLVASGVTSALGLFEAVFKVTAKAATGAELTRTFTVTGKVIDPAKEGLNEEDPPFNASCAAARTYKNLMLTGTNGMDIAALPAGSERMTGVLNLTIAKAAKKISAKYTCAAGNISFASTKTGVSADEGTHAFVATMPAKSGKFAGYVLHVEAFPDGNVDVKLSDGACSYTGSVIGAPWSKDNQATRWAGYYTVAFRPEGAVSNGVTCAAALSTGCPYLTLKMNSAGQIRNGTVRWAGLMPNGKSVSGSSALVRAAEGVAFLPTFKKSSTDVFSGLLQIEADAKACQGVGSVTLPAPDGVGVYSVWTHRERKSDEYSFEMAYRPFGGIYDLENGDLQCCCIEKFGLQTTNMLLNVEVPAGFANSAKYGPLESGVGPFSVEIDAKDIALVESGLSAECDAKLKFKVKTGVVSGTFLLPFQGQQVKAKYSAVLLFGFGDPCGCSYEDPTTANLMPFAAGSWYLSDKMADSTGGEISFKRGGLVNIDSQK